MERQRNAGFKTAAVPGLRFASSGLHMPVTDLKNAQLAV
jgi:hypothetical protein